jgi:VanZ family protein
MLATIRRKPMGKTAVTLRIAALWLLWAGSLALLTYGLLSPDPPEVGEKYVPSPLRFWASKAVHVGGYAYLSALVGFLPLTARGEAGVRLLLVAHGAATEYLQTFVEGRYGSVMDVGIDTAGIILGWASVLLWRRLRSRRRPPSPAAPSP